MPPANMDNFAQVFMQHGLRCTRQRRAIYEALLAMKSHPTADQLHQSVSRHIRGLSLATVYNSLEAFCEAGLAVRIAPNGSGSRGSGSARYDAAVDEHLHLRCVKSGRVADVPDDLGHLLLKHIPADVVRQVGDALGFHIDHLNIELIGRFETPAPQTARLPRPIASAS